MIVVRGIPVYWGVEADTPEQRVLDRRLLTYSVLNEILPPFRKSTYGLRFRVSPHHWLHVGKYLYDKTPGRYGIAATANDIARWGRAVPQESNEPEDVDSGPEHEVRSLES